MNCLTPQSRNFLDKPIAHSASQQIPCLLCKPKVHCRFHNKLPPDSILNQLNTIHTRKPYFPRNRSNIISHLHNCRKVTKQKRKAHKSDFQLQKEMFLFKTET
jgi:hypothetical protein